MTNVKEIPGYKNYGKCVEIQNRDMLAVVTVDIGPRIVFFGYKGGVNIMNDDKDAFAPLTNEAMDKFYYKGAAWNNYGGHRMWLSPESMPQTYYPDCTPVAYTLTENGVILVPAPQKENGVAYEIELSMDEKGLLIRHKATNIAEKAQQFAIWALTVSAKGGTEIIPMNTNDTGLLANRQIAVWPYTDLSDDRLYLGERYVTLKQTDKDRAFKLGFDNMSGCAYYVVGDTVFCKKYAANHPDGRYPDGGMSFETYTGALFTEIETIGELSDVEPGASIQHSELWTLNKKPCDFDERNDDSIESFLSKLN